VPVDDAAPEGFGPALRQARERAGLSLADIARLTRIREAYLAALECEDLAALPPPIYARGYLRAYARLVGLDPDPLVAAFNRAVPPAPRPHAGPGEILIEPGAAPSPALRYLRYAAWGALALGLFLTYVLIVQVIEFARPLPPSPQAAATAVPSPGGRSVVEGSPPPAPAVTPSPTPAALPGVTLTVSVYEASWLRVTADGERVFQGILEAGAARTWRAEREVTVRIGNAGGVDLTVNGKPLGPLGARGEVVTRTFRATPPMP
jgi:cytoskeletal protein RodZ